MIARWWWIVLAACSASLAEPSQPDVAADITRLGEAWRKNPSDTAPLSKLVELARARGAWKPAVPYIAESLATTDVALDAAFDAAVALGARDPAVTVAVLTPISTNEPNPRKGIPYEKIAAAEKRVGRAMVPAYLAAAKLVDQPAVRQRALSFLGLWRIAEARPLFLAVLKETPFTQRDANGSMTDPRGLLHTDAISGLAALGFDATSADALFAAAFDSRLWDGDRFSALRAWEVVAPNATRAQLDKLLEHALDPQHFDDAMGCGHAYALFATTSAELAKLAAAPKPNPPYFSGYAEEIAQGRRVLACDHGAPCLLALLETAGDRQYESFVLDKAMRELALHIDPATSGVAIAIVDELENRDQLEWLARWLPRIVPGPCPACAAHLEATLKRHARFDYMYEAPRAIETFRSRGGAGTTASAGAVDSFAAVAAAEHRMLQTASNKLDGTLLADNAFGFGVDASEVGSGAATLAHFTANDLAGAPRYDGVVRSRRGVRGNVMWDTELLLFEGPSYAMMSQLVVAEHGTFHVRAWSWSHLRTDQAAIDAVAHGKFPKPAPIADAHADRELDAAARRTLASRDAFVEALSTRDDACSFGNYHDEWCGGEARKAFAKMGAMFAIHDGVHVEKVSDDVGFAAANVDYKIGKSTRTFRVLAVFAKEGGAWRIVQSQWSYGMPIDPP